MKILSKIIFWAFLVTTLNSETIYNCPCEKNDIAEIPIVYGLPDKDLVEKSKKEKIYLMSCISVEDQNVVFKCRACGYKLIQNTDEWFKLGDINELKGIIHPFFEKYYENQIHNVQFESRIDVNNHKIIARTSIDTKEEFNNLVIVKIILNEFGLNITSNSFEGFEINDKDIYFGSLNATNSEFSIKILRGMDGEHSISESISLNTDVT